MTTPVSFIPRRLTPAERGALLAHLLALDTTDRRSRFGIAVSDEFVSDYANAVDFDNDAVFGVFDADLALVGAAHLALVPDRPEIGISVLPALRARGIGAALLARVRLYASNRGLRKLYLRCLRENTAMMHLARRENMHVTTESGETDAWVRLSPPTVGSFAAEVLADQAGLYDLGLKMQALTLRQVASAWSAAWQRRGRPAPGPLRVTS
jgi:GNAT superfamily N-acetyltransferase